MEFDCLILAAGRGTRMLPLTDNVPKCFIEFDGSSLIEKQLGALQKCGVKNVDIVTGYMAHKFEGFNCGLVLNEEFGSTNMVYSCLVAKHVFDKNDRDLLIFYSDVLMGSKAISQALKSSGDIVLVSGANWLGLWEKRFSNPCSDAESFTVQGNRVLDLGKPILDPSEAHGQFTGVFKISGVKRREFLDVYRDIVNRTSDAVDIKNLYMTDYITMLIKDGWNVMKEDIWSDWLEFDNLSDLELYNEMLQNGKLKGYFSS